VNAVLSVAKDRDPQITPIPQIFEFNRRNLRIAIAFRVSQEMEKSEKEKTGYVRCCAPARRVCL
jgi:hypothetical protein